MGTRSPTALEIYAAIVALGKLDDPAGRKEAAQTLLAAMEALQQHGSFARWSTAARSDAAGAVLLKLASNTVVPRHPERARGLLFAMFRNALISDLRSARLFHVSLDDLGASEQPKDGQQAADEVLVERERRKISGEAQARFMTVVVKVAAAGVRESNRDRFLTDVDRLFRMQLDGQTHAFFVEEALANGPHDDANVRTVSNALSQRNTRARGRLGLAIQKLAEEDALSPVEVKRMMSILFLLHERGKA